MEAQISGNGSSGEHVLELLSPFVDGETSADETRHVEKHLSECSLCANQLAFLRATARTLRRTADVFPSPALFERIARATYEKPTFAQRVSALLRPAPVRIGLSSALAAGLVFAALVPHRNGLVPSPPSGGKGKSNTIASVPPKAATPAHSDAAPLAAAPASFADKTASLGLAFARQMGANAIKAATEPVPTAPVRSSVPTPQTMTAGLTPRSLFPRFGNKMASTSDAAVAAVKALPPAAHLTPVRKPVQLAMNSNPVPRLWGGELTSRHLPAPRAVQPDFKIDANVPSAMASAAPLPVRPDIKSADPVVEATPVVSSGASETVAASLHVPARPDYKFHDSQRRSQDKNRIIQVSFDGVASASSLNGSVPIVKAPVN